MGSSTFFRRFFPKIFNFKLYMNDRDILIKNDFQIYRVHIILLRLVNIPKVGILMSFWVVFNEKKYKLLSTDKCLQFFLENSWYISIVNKLGLTYKGPRRQNGFEATTQPTEPRTSEESESSHVEENIRFDGLGVLSDCSSIANDQQLKENSIDLIMQNAENGCPLKGKHFHKIARHSKDCELIELE